MAKELIIAIFIGIILGFVIGFGVWRANRIINTAETASQTSNGVTVQSKDQTGATILTLSQPQDNEIVPTDELIIKGITQTESYIAITSKDDSFIQKTNTDGVFTIPTTVSPGLNYFKIKVLKDNQLTGELNFKIVYSTDFFEMFTPESNDDQKASDSATTRDESQLAQAQIDILKKSPTTYTGVITEKTDTTVELEGNGNQILQLAIQKTAQFIDIRKDSKEINKVVSKEIKFDDLAIGDHIAALGFKTENGVLETYRLLLTNVYDFSDRFMLYGTVEEIKNKVLTLSADNKTYDLTFPKTWHGPEIKEIETEDKVIVLGNVGDDSYTIEAIEIVSSNSN